MKRVDIQEKLDEAGKLLKELEDLIREDYETPKENIDISKYEGIKFPPNYIRTAEYFRREYNLDKLISNSTKIDNIAYSLQLSDFFNYLINRFHVYGIIKNLLIKQSIINLFSIIEGILYSTLMNLREFCVDGDKTCSKAGSCPYYLKSKNNLRFGSLLETYKLKIGFHNDKFQSTMEDIKEIRDNIHIEDIKYNEWAQDTKYHINTYNDSIISLKVLKNTLIDGVENFKKERTAGCSVRNKSSHY